MKGTPPPAPTQQRHWLTAPLIVSIVIGIITGIAKLPGGMDEARAIGRVIGNTAGFVLFPMFVAVVARLIARTPQAKRKAGSIAYWIVLVLLALAQLPVILGYYIPPEN